MEYYKKALNRIKLHDYTLREGFLLVVGGSLLFWTTVIGILFLC